MKIYTLTSTAFDGEVLFEFDHAGYLVKFDTGAANLSEQQQLWLLKKMPRHLAHIKQVLGDSDTASLTEVKEDITFDQFWNRYDEKVRSSKKRSQAIWNRMSKTQRLKAFRYIGKYEINIPNGVAKKYAESYLRAELWNN
jgi:hypothetical protein